MKSTASDEYTDRLLERSGKKWKMLLDVQRPYRWNIKRLNLGKTLDIGCGIGRLLEHLPEGSVGVDHNKASIAICKKKGLDAHIAKDFHALNHKKGSFKSMILTHVLEHVTTDEGVAIIGEYAPYVRDKVVVICPQEKGFASDDTHVNFLLHKDIEDILKECGFGDIKRSYSFPFPRTFGKIFTYNETVVVGYRTKKS